MINLKITAEERTNLLIKAKASREAKKSEFIANSHLLKLDFADKPHWKKLASKFGVRMPSDYVPNSEVRLARRAMRKCMVQPGDVKDALGMDIKAFSELNSTWPAFAVIGIILEIAEELTSKPLTKECDEVK